MKLAINYLQEVRAELSKVEWPKREEAVKLTITVVIITLIVGAYVSGLDYVFARLLEFLLGA